MNKIFLSKAIQQAFPVDEDAQEAFNKFPIGQKFEVLPWDERNYGFHKKLFSLVDLVVQNNPNWKAPYFLLKLIQLDLGIVEVGRDFQGIVKEFPKSIAFRNMKQIEFNDLFSKVHQHMLSNLAILIPGMSEKMFNSFVSRILNFT